MPETTTESLGAAETASAGKIREAKAARTVEAGERAKNVRENVRGCRMEIVTNLPET